jgi:hypothetical protein
VESGRTVEALTSLDGGKGLASQWLAAWRVRKAVGYDRG